MPTRALSLAALLLGPLVGCGPTTGLPNDDQDSTTTRDVGEDTAAPTATDTSAGSGASTASVTSQGGDTTSEDTTGSGDGTVSSSSGVETPLGCGAEVCDDDEFCEVPCCGASGCCFVPFKGGCGGQDALPGQCPQGCLEASDCCIADVPPATPSCRPMDTLTCDRDGPCGSDRCTGQLEARVLTCECPWG